MPKKSVFTREYQALVHSLFEARRASGLTQRQMGERLGRPHSFVEKYEAGERRLDVVEYFKIARILDIDPYRVLRKVFGKN